MRTEELVRVEVVWREENRGLDYGVQAYKHALEVSIQVLERIR